jgi:hypothetical protein
MTTDNDKCLLIPLAVKSLKKSCEFPEEAQIIYLIQFLMIKIIWRWVNQEKNIWYNVTIQESTHLTCEPPSHHGVRNGPYCHRRRQWTIIQIHHEVKYHCGLPSRHHNFNNWCQNAVELHIICPQRSIKRFRLKRSLPDDSFVWPSWTRRADTVVSLSRKPVENGVGTPTFHVWTFNCNISNICFWRWVFP